MIASKHIKLIFCIAIGIASGSCKTIKLSERAGKDIYLTGESKDLNGVQINNLIDTFGSWRNSFWQSVTNRETALKDSNAVVKIHALSPTRLKVSLMSGEEIISEKVLRGKYKRGFFKLRNRVSTDFMFGPVLWALAGFTVFIGLTKEGDIVLLESNAGSTMFFIMPFFPAGTHYESEYKRIRSGD